MCTVHHGQTCAEGAGRRLPVSGKQGKPLRGKPLFARNRDDRRQEPLRDRRARIFEHFSSWYRVRLALVRLDGVVAMLYGSLVDLACPMRRGRVIELAAGRVGTVAPGRDGEATPRRLARVSSGSPLNRNAAGCEAASIHRIAQRFEGWFQKPPIFSHSWPGPVAGPTSSRAMDFPVTRRWQGRPCANGWTLRLGPGCRCWARSTKVHPVPAAG